MQKRDNGKSKASKKGQKTTQNSKNDRIVNLESTFKGQKGRNVEKSQHKFQPQNEARPVEPSTKFEGNEVQKSPCNARVVENRTTLIIVLIVGDWNK